MSCSCLRRTMGQPESQQWDSANESVIEGLRWTLHSCQVRLENCMQANSKSQDRPKNWLCNLSNFECAPQTTHKLTHQRGKLYSSRWLSDGCPNDYLTSKVCRCRSSPEEIKPKNKDKNKMNRDIGGCVMQGRQIPEFKPRQVTTITTKPSEKYSRAHNF